MTNLSNLPTLTETVRRFGLRADKSLGQHFLLDYNICDRIARLALPLGEVVEIGPGPGGLTRALLANGADRVTVIETDERFVPALNLIGEAATGRLDMYLGDALNYDWSHTDGIKIVANLPYNVGTKMIVDWLTAPRRFWTQIVVMLQLEVAERICAAPGSPHYGRLAVLAQSVTDPRIAMGVPAHVFSPPPKVDSSVVVLDPLEQPFAELESLKTVTAAAFGQRRKMLRKSLRQLTEHVEAWLDPLGIDPTARPETLSVTQFQDVARSLPLP